jgi:hypothetical protein
VPQTEVNIVAVDLMDEAGVKSALVDIEALLEDVPVECILYNAAKVMPSTLLAFPSLDLQEALQVSC